MKQLATFEQWKAAGYVVRFGQKAQYCDINGKALFSREQVAETQKGWQPLIENPEPSQ